MNITIKFILTLAYLIVGGVIAGPYTFLSSGSFDNFLLTQLIAPIAALFLAIVHLIERGLLERKSRWTRMLGGWFFWGVVTYFCLPIIMNGASLLLNSMGYGKAGHYAFEFRYATILVVPALLAVATFIAVCAADIPGRFKSGFRSPTNPV